MSDVPSARSCHRTILIADIVSSTALYETLGDATAKRMVESCLEILRQATGQHGGKVVKHLGDGMLCSFEELHVLRIGARPATLDIPHAKFIKTTGNAQFVVTA